MTRYRLADIVAHASDVFDVPIAEIEGRSRFKNVNRARQVVFYLARSLTPLSGNEIGRRLGRDHSTVLHGVKQTEAMMLRDAKFRAQVHAICEALDGKVEEAERIRAQQKRLQEIETERRERQRKWQVEQNPFHKRDKRRIEAQPDTNVKPKNDFRAEADPDGSHVFATMMAFGSARLAEALQNARAAR